jgi:hypothetical protein
LLLRQRADGLREITARTEEYWCPIKHAQRVLAAHAHYSEFADYGDAEGYRRLQDKLREKSKTNEGGA